ncbi:hypothetical protein HDV00_000420 [Rhizophlyctis rosea]|nr:hypothetical protein HDV00_000420 [Rhizophlyctis rosea]
MLQASFPPMRNHPRYMEETAYPSPTHKRVDSAFSSPSGITSPIDMPSTITNSPSQKYPVSPRLRLLAPMDEGYTSDLMCPPSPTMTTAEPAGNTGYYMPSPSHDSMMGDFNGAQGYMDGRPRSDSIMSVQSQHGDGMYMNNGVPRSTARPIPMNDSFPPSSSYRSHQSHNAQQSTSSMMGSNPSSYSSNTSNFHDEYTPIPRDDRPLPFTRFDDDYSMTPPPQSQPLFNHRRPTHTRNHSTSSLSSVACSPSFQAPHPPSHRNTYQSHSRRMSYDPRMLRQDYSAPPMRRFSTPYQRAYGNGNMANNNGFNNMKSESPSWTPSSSPIMDADVLSPEDTSGPAPSLPPSPTLTVVPPPSQQQQQQQQQSPQPTPSHQWNFVQEDPSLQPLEIPAHIDAQTGTAIIDGCPIDITTDDEATSILGLSGARFKCQFPDCNKLFEKLSNLKQHARLHRAERNWRCDAEGCGRAFMRRQDLRRHKAGHGEGGGRKWECGNCGTKFTRSDALHRHVKAKRCL